MNEINKTPKQIYDEFWKEIIEKKDGTINMKQLKKELFDFYFIMEQIPRVYCHITGSKLSKLMYDADTVIECADEHYEDIYQEDIQEAVSDAMRELKGKCEKDERFESGSQKKGEGFIYLQTLTELINKYIGGEK